MFVVIAILVFGIPLGVFVTNALMNRFTRIDYHKTPFYAGYLVTTLSLFSYCIASFILRGNTYFSLGIGAVYIIIFAACVIFLNWFVFTLTDVSMHVRIAYILYSNGALSPQEIQGLYNKNIILKNRISRLIELGQIREVHGYYVLGRREVLFGAGVCKVLRKLLGIPVSPELQDHTKT